LGVVVVRLTTETSAQKVWAVYNMKERDVRRAFRLVERHHTMLLQAWRGIHDETLLD
jgi:hypothetical protein